MMRANFRKNIFVFAVAMLITITALACTQSGTTTQQNNANQTSADAQQPTIEAAPVAQGRRLSWRERQYRNNTNRELASDPPPNEQISRQRESFGKEESAMRAHTCEEERQQSVGPEKLSGQAIQRTQVVPRYIDLRRRRRLALHDTRDDEHFHRRWRSSDS